MRAKLLSARWLSTIAVTLLGVAMAGLFWQINPFESYLLQHWEADLATIADEDVAIRIEQIAAIGEQSFPTLVAAIHSERSLVAKTAATMLIREMSGLELRSRADSSKIIAALAHELAERSKRPGPYSSKTSINLATRILLWPVDREFIDSEQLVADCEFILNAAKRSPASSTAPVFVDDEELGSPLVRLADNSPVVPPQNVLPTPIANLSQDAGVNVPLQLVDTPALPPQSMRDYSPTRIQPSSTQLLDAATPRLLAATRGSFGNEPTPMQETKTAEDDHASHPMLDDRHLLPSVAEAQADLRGLSDLEVMRTMTGTSNELAGAAITELYWRGFESQHIRLSKMLVAEETGVRLQLVRKLPQMAGVDSRPWLLWLSRDEEPIVRKAVVAVLATSSDPALQQRIREMQLDETDDDVLRLVRQVLDRRSGNAVR